MHLSRLRFIQFSHFLKLNIRVLSQYVSDLLQSRNKFFRGTTMKLSFFNGYLNIITLILLAMMRDVESVAKMERRLVNSLDPGVFGLPVESSYWEFILREFVFKTISPPPPANNKLYKRLLEAPFYGGPFPALKLNNRESSQLLSRGDVYQLSNGGWIMCQEGCVECDICQEHNAITIPTVKWILRIIKRRLVPFTLPRYDLQLTILPQNDNSFHMKNLSPFSYVYVTSNQRALNNFTDTLISKNKEYPPQYPFGTTKLPRKISENIFTTSKTKTVSENELENKGSDIGNGVSNELRLTTSTTSSETQAKTTISPSKKRGREITKGKQDHRHKIDANRTDENIIQYSKPKEKTTPLTLFYPSTVSKSGSNRAGCRLKKDPRLILGTDQFGKKHIVHVIPAGDLDMNITSQSPGSGTQFVHRSSLGQEYEDRPLYRKIFRRVMDSLNIHKKAIEKFLFTPNRGVEDSFISLKSFEDEKNVAAVTSTNSNKILGGKVDRKNEKNTIHSRDNNDTILRNDVGVSSLPRDMPLSNYNTTQSEQPLTVSGEGSKPKLATSRKLKIERKPQSVEPTVLNNVENKMPSNVSDGAWNESRPTIYAGEEITGYTVKSLTVNSTKSSNESGTTSNKHLNNYPVHLEESDVISDKKNLNDSLFRSIEKQNNTNTLILKEVARSVVNHADTLQGFNLLNNTRINYHSNSDDNDKKLEADVA